MKDNKKIPNDRKIPNDAAALLLFKSGLCDIQMLASDLTSDDLSEESLIVLALSHAIIENDSRIQEIIEDFLESFDDPESEEKITEN